MKTFTLEEFQNACKTEFKDSILKRTDVIDMDGGTMTVYKENLGKYLEQYMCKDAEDLQDTMWFSYGVFVNVVE